ncbi:hypothetical protein QAD02_013647 [Eretmocerus hayati]|uniref:Uncharacterized protein n=1 Tax=Eretmocerus hayati TaxID=131215 RepID=A0ACC2P2S4_9HYME|nr:hypothetical protein QAD02_013647 [Eretmocerus hayati]
MGCSLMDFPAFSFEKFLGKLQNLVESGNKLLTQFCNKITDYLQSDKPEEKPTFEILREKKVKSNEPSVYTRIRLRNCELSLNNASNVVMLDTGEIMRIKSMTNHTKTKNLEDITIEGSRIQIIGPAVKFPCNSSILDMYGVDEKDGDDDQVVSQMSLVKCKMILLKIFETDLDEERDMYTMPLLHMN